VVRMNFHVHFSRYEFHFFGSVLNLLIEARPLSSCFLVSGRYVNECCLQVKVGEQK
jgi:hypothetical protein